MALEGLEDPAFVDDLAGRGAAIVPASEGALDLVFLRVDRAADLLRIGDLRPCIRLDGALWVLREKGAARVVREVDVIDAGRRFQMVDNKIASFSPTLAAMRLVIPLALRGR